MDLLGGLGELNAPSTIILHKFLGEIKLFKDRSLVEVLVHSVVVLTCYLNGGRAFGKPSYTFVQLDAIVH